MTAQRETSKGSTISKQAKLSSEDPRTTDGGNKVSKITHIDYHLTTQRVTTKVTTSQVTKSPVTTQRGTTKNGAIPKQAELSLTVVPLVLVISIPDFKH